MTEERIILGIDPGTNLMGFGIIKCVGNQHTLLEIRTLTLRNTIEPLERLDRIFKDTSEIIKQFKVTEAAIEEPFYGKNVQSMLKLGRAQGMAIAAALHNNISIAQYAPRKIKQAITGNGNASKEQVAAMLKKLLFIQDLPASLDATDGLAVAVCHFYQKNVKISSGGSNSWKAFIRENPGRIK